MAPLVSVIIPTYNRAHLLGRAIRSVLAQTRQDFELIVVDDASTDNTREVVGGFADPRVRYVRHDVNRGGTVAMNTGLQEARGEYVTFLDDDDEYLPQKLEKQLETFTTSDLKELGVVVCGFAEVWDDAPGAEPQVRLPAHRGWIYEDVMAIRGWWGPPLLMVRRPVSGPLFTFDEGLSGCEDWDYLLRLAQRWQVEVLPEPLVRVHNHAGPRMGNTRDELRDREQLVEKYARELQARPWALARHHLHMAANFYRLGDRRGQILHLWKALLAYPRDLRQYGRLLGAFLRLYPRRGLMKSPLSLHSLKRL